ncbi:MAG: hypothetical protein YK1309IOTA_1930007 [Marine Group I thaumarchaeote]|nr:MAG: hypothetical protein YK1309IOTA_1930007 [Marine Group I thaumarchaeote]
MPFFVIQRGMDQALQYSINTDHCLTIDKKLTFITLNFRSTKTSKI